MAMIHDKYVIELKEVIKGYGNDPQVKDPLKFPCDYKFYEIDGVAICEDSFKKMKQLEDVAIPKAEYEAKLKADMIAILTEIKLKIAEKSYYDTMIIGNYEDEVRIDLVELDDVNDVIQNKINTLEVEDGNND